MAQNDVNIWMSKCVSLSSCYPGTSQQRSFSKSFKNSTWSLSRQLNLAIQLLAVSNNKPQITHIAHYDRDWYQISMKSKLQLEDSNQANWDCFWSSLRTLAVCIKAAQKMLFLTGLIDTPYSVRHRGFTSMISNKKVKVNMLTAEVFSTIHPHLIKALRGNPLD